MAKGRIAAPGAGLGMLPPLKRRAGNVGPESVCNHCRGNRRDGSRTGAYIGDGGRSPNHVRRCDLVKLRLHCLTFRHFLVG
jgi:hypothetical protein